MREIYVINCLVGLANAVNAFQRTIINLVDPNKIEWTYTCVDDEINGDNPKESMTRTIKDFLLPKKIPLNMNKCHLCLKEISLLHQVTTIIFCINNINSLIFDACLTLPHDKTAFQWKILDQCSNLSKLVTLEALYIRTPKPAIKTRDEYRTRELTLKA